jgi:hypothetical protein
MSDSEEDYFETLKKNSNNPEAITIKKTPE